MKWLVELIKEIPNKLATSLVGILLVIFILINSYFIYKITLFNNIENFLRYSVIIFIIILSALMCIYFYKTIFKRKWSSYIILAIILTIISTSQYFLIVNLNKIFSTVDSMNKEYITYSTSLITLKNSTLNTIGDVKNIKIGIINDTNSIEGYIISREIINENKLDDNGKNTIIEYEDFLFMLNDLYEGKVDAIFLSSNYHIMFSSIERFKNIVDETKIIISKDKKMAKPDIINQPINKAVTEPFTLLIMGVDSTYGGLTKNAAFNGDALLLVTFNPMTLNATVLSIPRDTYVPIMCFRGRIENKIAHAAWYGESCMIRTIENFTGIKIDYYTKINFAGLVQLIDALGGINVDVPIKFCEQNSYRAWGRHTICLNKGVQALNGEQALALARHRNTLLRGDIQRGEHQKLVISGIINKIKSINSLNQVYNLMDAVSKNVDTNLTTNQILGFYNIGKDIMAKGQLDADENIIGIQKLHLSGYDKTIWDEGMRQALYNYVYYKGSLTDVVNAMKVNLDLKNEELIKEFSFSINNVYIPEIIGKGNYKVDYIIHTVPDFTRNSKTYAINWADQHNITINFITIDNTSPEYRETFKNDAIIYQSIPYAYRVDRINNEVGITLKIVKKATTPVPINCLLEQNYNNPSCLIPDMTDWTLDKFNKWVDTAPGSFIVNKIMLETSDPLYDIIKAGLIYEQSKLPGTKIIDIAELTIKYYELLD